LNTSSYKVIWRRSGDKRVSTSVIKLQEKSLILTLAQQKRVRKGLYLALNASRSPLHRYLYEIMPRQHPAHITQWPIRTGGRGWCSEPHNYAYRVLCVGILYLIAVWYCWRIVIYLRQGVESVGTFRPKPSMMSVTLRRRFHVFPSLRHENPLVSNVNQRAAKAQ
jgi:hypothetical protein